MLGLHPSASVIEIAAPIGNSSKRYLPDTTVLPARRNRQVQQLDEPTATLSSPERRLTYDLKLALKIIRYSVPPDLNRPSRSLTDLTLPPH